MKRLISTLDSVTIDEAEYNINYIDIRIWAYGYLKGTTYMSDDHLYAVIIANDSVFSGK